MNQTTDQRAQAQPTAVDGLLAALTPEQVIEAREKLGPLCLWCGASATLLCDTRIAPGFVGATCDAPLCPQCTAPVFYTGCTLPGPSAGSFDTCPACVERKTPGRRCDDMTPDEHRAMVREHAAARSGS